MTHSKISGQRTKNDDISLEHEYGVYDKTLATLDISTTPLVCSFALVSNSLSTIELSILFSSFF